MSRNIQWERGVPPGLLWCQLHLNSPGGTPLSHKLHHLLSKWVYGEIWGILPATPSKFQIGSINNPHFFSKWYSLCIGGGSWPGTHWYFEKSSTSNQSLKKYSSINWLPVHSEGDCFKMPMIASVIMMAGCRHSLSSPSWLLIVALVLTRVLGHIALAATLNFLYSCAMPNADNVMPYFDM